MTLQSWLLAFALATIYGAAFHLWRGGNARRLLLYLLAGWLGFALGQGLGELLSLTILKVGQIHLLPATLGSAIALGAASILARAEVFDSDSPSKR
jgi:hypothetical protein